MKSKIELVAEIIETEQGLALRYAIPRLLQATLAEIGVGNKVRNDIKKWYKKRTGQQNKYLWSLVYPTILHHILEKTGQKFSAEKLHERYKEKFLGYVECSMVPGLREVKSTTKTSTVEFSDEFVELICIEWADNGLYIPPPDPKWKEKT